MNSRAASRSRATRHATNSPRVCWPRRWGAAPPPRYWSRARAERRRRFSSPHGWNRSGSSRRLIRPRRCSTSPPASSKSITCLRARACIWGRLTILLPTKQFDAATLIGVIHHLPGEGAKRDILRSIALRLKPNAPLILAGNHYAYASQPLLLAAWGERWRMSGASADEVKSKLAKILQGADPPHGEAAVASLLENAGFAPPLRFFSSLFLGRVDSVQNRRLIKLWRHIRRRSGAKIL